MTDAAARDLVRAGYDAMGEPYHAWSHASPVRLAVVATMSMARRLAPGGTFVQADILELALRTRSVDAVVSFFALGHLPASAHGPLLSSIGSWLRPGGVLVTSAPLTPGEAVEDDWLGVPMFFGGIGIDATLTAVEAAGLVVEEAEVVAEDEQGTEKFLWVTAVRPA